MMSKKIVILIFSLFFVFDGISASKELTSFYRGIRPLGMGDAFTAISNDENAVFYNPAGLNSVVKGRVELINPTVGYSQNTMDFLNDVQDLDSDDVSASTDMLDKHMGNQMGLRVSVFPNWTRHNFSAGAFALANVGGAIHNPPFPYMDIDASTDGGAIVGLARSFTPEDKLQMGVSLKFVQRRGITRTYDATDIANEDYDVDEDLETGTGFGVNVGAIYNLERTLFGLKPSFGVAVQNVGGMKFGDELAEVEQKVNIGVVLKKEMGLGALMLALDYKDLFANVGLDDDKGKRLHIGGELKFKKLLAVRAGLNQGWGTFGLTIDLWLIKVSYAMYYEELGAYAGQLKDQRHVFQLVLGW